MLLFIKRNEFKRGELKFVVFLESMKFDNLEKFRGLRIFKFFVFYLLLYSIFLLFRSG